MSAGRGAAIADLARLPVVQMTAAQLFNGACAYAFLGLATRQLGDIEFAPLSVAWVAFFLLGSGCFMPLEQQLSRGLAGRFPSGVGAGPTVRRGMRLLLVGVVVLTAVQLAASSVLVDELFSGRWDVLIGLVIGVAGFATLHAGRGISAGLGRPRVWATLFVVEGVLELVAAVVLKLSANRDAGTFTIAAGGASLAAGLLVLGLVVPELVRPRVAHPDHPHDDHPHQTVEHIEGPSLAVGLPALVVSSVITAALMNAGPLAVQLLANDDQSAEAGHFLTGLVVARIPVFLVPVIVSLLLPSLTASVTSGDHPAFRTNVTRLGAAIGAAVIVSTVGAAIVGPTAVRIAFGAEFGALGARDLGAMAFSSVTLVGAVAIGQAALALHQERWLTAAWVGAAVAFAAGLASSDDLFLRVESGLALSSAVALAVVVVVVIRGARTLDEVPGVPGPAGADC
ncbi:MAG: hypothetical protein U0Q22_05440 [Acidimicrobiales bacterium]